MDPELGKQPSKHIRIWHALESLNATVDRLEALVRQVQNAPAPEEEEKKPETALASQKSLVSFLDSTGDWVDTIAGRIQRATEELHGLIF